MYFDAAAKFFQAGRHLQTLELYGKSEPTADAYGELKFYQNPPPLLWRRSAQQ